eukprot:gene29289-36456_t
MSSQVPIDGIPKEAVKFVLEATPFGLTPFTDEQAFQLLKYAEIETFPKNSYVFREGDLSDKFYFLWKGSVALENQGHPCFEYAPGQTFGEVGIVEDAPRRAAIRVMEEATVLSLHRRVLDNTSHDLDFALLRSVYKYLGKRVTGTLLGSDFYENIDVLLLQ